MRHKIADAIFLWQSKYLTTHIQAVLGPCKIHCCTHHIVEGFMQVASSDVSVGFRLMDYNTF